MIAGAHIWYLGNNFTIGFIGITSNNTVIKPINMEPFVIATILNMMISISKLEIQDLKPNYSPSSLNHISTNTKANATYAWPQLKKVIFAFLVIPSLVEEPFSLISKMTKFCSGLKKLFWPTWLKIRSWFIWWISCKLDLFWLESVSFWNRNIKRSGESWGLEQKCR